MKIAVVSPYSLDHPGGVQSHAQGLVAALRAGGDEAWLVAPGTGPPGPHVRLVGNAVRVPANRSKAPISLSPRVVRRVREAVAGADVVHTHEPLMPLAGWAALRRGPQVLTFHADPSRLVRRAYRHTAPLLRRIVRDAAAVTAVSRVAAGALAPFAPRVEVIPNAIEVARYRPEDVQRVPGRVVFLGRDDPRKGLDVLVAAWPQIRETVPGAELHIMGVSGEPGLGMCFLGRVPDGRKHIELAQAEMLCAPNRGGESFGITLLEGMAAGCAVVATELPAFKDLAGAAAAFVAVDDVDGLAGACIELLTDPRRMAAAGRSAAARADAFDWSQVVPRYRQIYTRAIEERVSGRGR